jgi:3-keto-5-aminohexanoate cleavage enzyme
MSGDKVIVTCALTGVLTDPAQHHVPVTPAEMAASAKEAFDAGASIMHVHYRSQKPGMGMLPTWEPDVAGDIVDAIREACPGVIINSTTGVMGPDISGPTAVLERVKPEMAAMNAGTLNYLKLRRDGKWAWPPILFDNPVEKIEKYVKVMRDNDIVPECECFDTGIVRSVALLVGAGILQAPPHISLVMGVASGMPAKADWLPLLVDEMLPGSHWQTILIGRQNVWDVHRRAAELGGNLRTGVEDTFYLPDGEKTSSNGKLIEALVAIARERGREPATADEVRASF